MSTAEYIILTVPALYGTKLPSSTPYKISKANVQLSLTVQFIKNLCVFF